MSSERIAVAYSGVHQAFQLALAAHEERELQAFYCSLYDAPGKWGNLLGRIIGGKTLASRRIEGLPPSKAVEFPWPLLWKGLRDRIQPGRANDWLSVNDAFDRRVAAWMKEKPPRIFVGGETCDLHCLEAAHRLGIVRIHDCPQLHPLFLKEVLKEAAERAGLQAPQHPDLPEMAERKRREYELADKLLIYSDVHRRSFLRAGFPEDRLFQCPLWVDPALWNRDAPMERSDVSRPLRILFVGSMNLRKGVPFLLDAVRACGKAVQVTLVGSRDAQCEPLLARAGAAIRVLPPQPKRELRRIYAAHDVFVLPSVADSFGFVALEAMACGLPVIVTTNCGAPVPDESWRVPPMDAEALARRIMQYADHHDLLDAHARQAMAFAAQFSPATYRRNIRGLFRKLLAP